MAIQNLEITNLRNLANIAIHPESGINFVFGPNGSGKTSLLEAIHCLGRGKSFRTHKTNHLIKEGSEAFRVVGKIQQQGRTVVIGMERRPGTSHIRMGGQPISRASELSEVLPIAVLNPGLHQLIEEGPEQRRRFLDWGVFHVEHSFNGIWNNYRRSLAQRNAALRSGWSPQAIAHWDQELVLASEQLDQARRQYLAGLLVFIRETLNDFPAIADVDIQYQQGWRSGVDYATYLTGQYHSDKERGFTQFGPHRADLRIRINAMDARDFLSRGQQKVLVANMILAQCQQMSAQGNSVVILVDDLPAELDGETRETLLQTLQDTQAQVFLTATDAALFKKDKLTCGVFHVEHGQIRAG